MWWRRRLTWLHVKLGRSYGPARVSQVDAVFPGAATSCKREIGDGRQAWDDVFKQQKDGVMLWGSHGGLEIQQPRRHDAENRTRRVPTGTAAVGDERPLKYARLTHRR